MPDEQLLVRPSSVRSLPRASVSRALTHRLHVLQECANGTAPSVRGHTKVAVITQVDGTQRTVKRRNRACTRSQPILVRSLRVPSDSEADPGMGSFTELSTAPPVLPPPAKVASYGAHSAAINAAWARKNGYAFLVVGSVALPTAYDRCELLLCLLAFESRCWMSCASLSPCQTDIRSRYAKVPVVSNILSDHNVDLVFWIDADAVVVRLSSSRHDSRPLNKTYRRIAAAVRTQTVER